MKVQVRREKLLYGWRQPVEPVAAATVILVRDGEPGLEILMTRRSEKASFAPGAYVFPGGRVDPADIDEATASDDRSHDDNERPYAVAAIRETFEELGILLARSPSGQAAGSEQANRLDRSQSGRLFQQLKADDLSPALDQLSWFSHWITDPDLPKRFDTRFFVATMPSGQTPLADESEQFDPVWINPEQGLARHAARDFKMIFPTIRTLRALSQFGSVSDLFAHCQSQGRVKPIQPRGAMLAGKVSRYSDEELPYGEIALVSPDGQIRHHLDWQHEPVRLLKHVWRITAPNPGRMTGPGTNTYIIGEPGDYLVIDPGPNLPEHLQRIAELVGDGLKTILCTHSHPDHYPGAIPLRDLLKLPDVPILGIPSGPDFNPAWPFEPDQTVVDNQVIRCAGDHLRVLHTPGHASNHVCLLLEEDGLLFSGDHILNGSTTVIDPPDGNMSAYFDSLARLSTEALTYIAPAHGHVIARPYDEIDRLRKHRLKREAKVLAALDTSGGGELSALVKYAYDDVDPILHPVALRSLRAHLEKLADENRAKLDGNQWQKVPR